MNIDNLKLLKQGLEDNFNRFEKHFTMDFHRSKESENGYGLDAVEFKSKTDSGSHGCLLGLAPLLDIKELEPVESDYGYESLDFNSYCGRVFGIEIISDPIWDYLFGGYWVDYDNTLQGAINRLEKVISGEVAEGDAKTLLPWIDRER